MRAMWVAGLALFVSLTCAGPREEGAERDELTRPARGNPSAPNDPRAEARATGAGPGAGASASTPSGGDDDLGAYGPTAPTGGGITSGGEPGAYGGYGAGPKDLDTPTPARGGPVPNARVGLPEPQLQATPAAPRTSCGRLSACFAALAESCRSEGCRERYEVDMTPPAGRCEAMLERGLEDVPRLLPRLAELPPVCAVP